MNIRYINHTALIALLLVALLGSSRVYSQTMEVMAITPPETDQGTVNLDVTITGDGFEEGAQAVFLVAGTLNPGGITVNHTHFKDSRTLVANLDIDECAVVGQFDIEVLTLSGRRGKGNTLMSVRATETGPNPQCEDGTADFSGDLRAALEAVYVRDLGLNYEDMAGKLTGNERMIVKGDAATAIMFFDDACRLPETDSKLCSIKASGKGVLPLGARRRPANCGQAPELTCNAIVFDASTGLEWNIRHDFDNNAGDRIQLQLRWNNENGEQHYLHFGWAARNEGLSCSDFGELFSLLNPDSLRSATVEFLADPFSLQGDLLFGNGKRTKRFIYSDYGEDGTVTFSIETSVP